MPGTFACLLCIENIFGDCYDNYLFVFQVFLKLRNRAFALPCISNLFAFSPGCKKPCFLRGFLYLEYTTWPLEAPRRSCQHLPEPEVHHKSLCLIFPPAHLAGNPNNLALCRLSICPSKDKKEKKKKSLP